MKLISANIPPAGINFEKLNEDLANLLGIKYGGVPAYSGEATLTFSAADNITPQEEADAVALVTNHDKNQLSARQQREANLAEAIQRIKNSNFADMSPAQIYTAMQNQIDGWATLADAKANLREWIPLMAAAIVARGRRES